jgi:hypothetical protein
MTRTNDTQIHHTVLLNQAQGEVGQDIAKTIKTGFQMIEDLGAKLRRAVTDLTTPPTAVA